MIWECPATERQRSATVRRAAMLAALCATLTLGALFNLLGFHPWAIARISLFCFFETLGIFDLLFCLLNTGIKRLAA